MKFWDASALMPLLYEEPSSNSMMALTDADPQIVVWKLTSVEIASAIWRRYRDSRDEEMRARATEEAAKLVGTCVEVDELEPVARTARQLVSVHPLKAADALQLAAAWHAAKGAVKTLPFVTLDRQLAAAARAEGFPVLP